MNETLQNYAVIAEIVGAAAVVLSLIFVGLEVRRSNRLALAATHNAATQRWIAEYAKWFGTEESTAFMRKALHHYETLSKDEKGRFYDRMIALIGTFDTLHEQYENGLLREDTYLGIGGAYYALVSMSGAQELLDDIAANLPPYLVTPSGVFVGEKLPVFPFLDD